MNRRRAVRGVALFALMAGCSDSCAERRAEESDAKPPSIDAAPALEIVWPEFPKTRDDAIAIARASHRASSSALDSSDASASDVVARVLRAIDAGQASVGWSAIDGVISRRVDRALAEHKHAWMLFGTHHDSVEQLRAFARLTGALAHTRFRVVALEQFHATGHYGGIADDDQRGDDDTIARFVNHGDLDALDELRREQATDDYAAWKYDYVPDVIDLAVSARAKGAKLLGCELPTSLRTRLPAGIDDETMWRLRENHCVLALSSFLAREPEPLAIALFYGDEHVFPRGFPSAIAERDDTFAIHVLGARASATDPDESIAKKIVALDPVLVEHDTGATLLLPESGAQRHVDRARTSRDAPGPAAIEIRATYDTRVHLGAHSFVATSHPRVTPALADRVAFAWEKNDRVLIAEIETPEGALVEIDLDDTAPELRVVVHTASSRHDL